MAQSSNDTTSEAAGNASAETYQTGKGCLILTILLGALAAGCAGLVLLFGAR